MKQIKNFGQLNKLLKNAPKKTNETKRARQNEPNKSHHTKCTLKQNAMLDNVLILEKYKLCNMTKHTMTCTHIITMSCGNDLKVPLNYCDKVISNMLVLRREGGPGLKIL